MSRAPIRILLVEDNPGDARLLREELKAPGLEESAVTHVETLGAALERLGSERFDVVLLDLSLPDGHGLETVIRMAAHAPETPIVVLTGLDDEEMALRAVHAGAQDYLVKGELGGRALARAIRYAIERARLLASEREKSEQLKLSVREAHHRIKNNLQAISDLLYLELSSGEVTSPGEALRESMERVQAIALVHDLLSQDEDVRTVDTRAVIERLVPMVLHAAGLEGLRLRLDAVSARLSSKQGTSLALIVNELVSNAAKHAYRNGRHGCLTITLQEEAGELALRVRDDGPGLPPGFDLRTDAHVGLDVVRILAERDLAGTFALRTEEGVLAEVRFRR